MFPHWPPPNTIDPQYYQDRQARTNRVRHHRVDLAPPPMNPAFQNMPSRGPRRTPPMRPLRTQPQLDFVPTTWQSEVCPGNSTALAIKRPDFASGGSSSIHILSAPGGLEYVTLVKFPKILFRSSE